MSDENAKIRPGQGGAHSEPQAEKKARLRHLEGFVRGYQLSWRVGGEALREISESKLYLLRAATFADYARKSLEISAKQAHDLIAAACVARNLRGRKEVVNGTEHWPDEIKHTLSLRAALVLTRLADDVQSKCLARVIELTKTKGPTARQIERVIEHENWPVKPGWQPKPKRKRNRDWREKLPGGEFVLRVKSGADALSVYAAAIEALRAKIVKLKSAA